MLSWYVVFRSCVLPYLFKAAARFRVKRFRGLGSFVHLRRDGYDPSKATEPRNTSTNSTAPWLQSSTSSDVHVS